MTLWRDILHGFRLLLKKPGFTAVASLSLALGISANTVIFSLIDTTLLRPLPFPDAGQLVRVTSAPIQRPDQVVAANFSTYAAFRDRSRSFAAVGGFNLTTHNLGAEQDGAPAERVNAQDVTPSMFQVLGVKPLLGRVFTDAEDEVENAAPVVVISQRFWQRRFNGDASIIGKTLTVDKSVKTVIGVMPPEFNFYDGEADFWSPLPMTRTQTLSKAGFFLTFARLKTGVSIKQAHAEMSTLAAQLATSDPERNQGNGALVVSLQEALYGNVRSPLLILQGAVAFVLLIACANVAGLLLARAASRRTEVAIRTALGAGRGRIVRQLLTESLPLSVLGGILGIAFAWAGLKLFVATAPSNFPRLEAVSLDAQALGFTALLAILTSVIFGMIPAMQASKLDLVKSLNESGRSGTEGVARHRLQSGMVTVQIALALVLLIGAGLMVNSFVRTQKSDLGADPKGVLTFDFRFPQTEAIKPVGRYRGVGLYDINPATTITFERVFERMRGLPGVISAAGISRLPRKGAGVPMPFLIEGRPAPSLNAGSQQTQSADYFAITPDFFATMNIPLIRGRDFTVQDTSSAPLVIIINETMARRFFPNEDPIGKRLTLDFVPNEQPREIIAVVGDILLNRFQSQRPAVAYVAHTQQTSHWLGTYWPDRTIMNFLVRTSGDPLSFAASVQHAAAEVDPNRPVGSIRSLEQFLDIDQQVQDLRLYLLLLGVFGSVAVVLAAIGIYGVMAYSVGERTREIGIRIALGADSGNVLALVARQALVLISIGLALGLAGSFALTSMIKSALYGVTATDPATYIGVALLLALVALAASVIPARRAAGVDPAAVLR